MQKKHCQYSILLILAIFCSACSWHRKEIAYLKTKYYGCADCDNDLDSAAKILNSIKLSVPGRYDYKESKSINSNENQTWYSMENYLATEFNLEYLNIESEKIDNDSLNFFKAFVKWGPNYYDNLDEIAYQINIYKSKESKIDSAILEISYNSNCAFKNKRYFLVDSKSVNVIKLWIEKALLQNKQLPFPKSIINNLDLTFRNSTTYLKSYHNQDSTHSKIIKIDSVQNGNKIIVNNNSEFFNYKTGRLFSKKIIQTECAYEEEHFTGSLFPSYLYKLDLNPTKTDTLLKKALTMEKVENGFAGTLHIVGRLLNSFHQNDYQKKQHPVIILTHINILIDSNYNYLYEAELINELGDTILIIKKDSMGYSDPTINCSKNSMPIFSNYLRYYAGIPIYGVNYYRNNSNINYFLSQEYKQCSAYISILNTIMMKHFEMSQHQLYSRKKMQKRAIKEPKRKIELYNYNFKIRRPEYFRSETKLLEKNRREGYEKRIKIEYDGDYTIYEIYYKDVGKGNELVPIE